jgi:hypothetical protein
VFEFVMATTMNHFPPLTLQSGNDFSGIGFIAHDWLHTPANVKNQERMRIMMRMNISAWHYAFLGGTTLALFCGSQNAAYAPVSLRRMSNWSRPRGDFLDFLIRVNAQRAGPRYWDSRFLRE